MDRDILDLQSSQMYEEEDSPKTFIAVETSCAHFLREYPGFKQAFNDFLSLSLEAADSPISLSFGKRDQRGDTASPKIPWKNYG